MSRQLHICFFPLMGQGHTIPAINMAKLFASRGLKTTIITTPFNADFHSKTITDSQNTGLDISTLVIKFPCVVAGMPEGCESPDLATTPETVQKFYRATTMLDKPLENLLREYKPHCLVADMFFPWATAVAAKFGIPRIVFHGTGFFSLCASLSLLEYEPHEKVESDSEPFVVPNLPDEVILMRKQLPPYVRRNARTEFAKVYRAAKESEFGCFGVVVNSFYELEPDYADHYGRVIGRKVWHIGPISLLMDTIGGKGRRGRSREFGDELECLKWLDLKEANSVVYVCFGSMSSFSDAQLMEIATGLEATGQQFIWVVKKEKKEGVREEWLPEGFEKRMEGKGLIIRGWAPQVLILEHEAVGGFVTHCGWNSTLEAVCAGVPMVTWPVFAEQFYNEKLVTQILRIGVEVGAQKWERLVGDFVKKEALEKAVSRIMGGEEVEGMRARAKTLAEMASMAIEQGGSSYSDLDALIEEVKLLHNFNTSEIEAESLISRSVNMSSETSQLHIFFFPFMAHGHMIPAVDMAKLFASRGCKTTVILTPANAAFFTKAIERSRNLGSEIQILLVKFPVLDDKLPEGCENVHLLTTNEMVHKFFDATAMLEQPLEQLIKDHRPDCLIADSFFLWATEVAARFAIPRLLFHGFGFFALCASVCMLEHRPYKKVSSDSEHFVIPSLPHEIKLTRDQVPLYVKQESEATNFARKVFKSEVTSYGVIVNSYYELEPDYADHYRRVLGRKAWHIGPICLVNNDKEDKAKRGPKSSIDEHECLNWLNSKKPNSVVYVSFGSIANFNDTQLMEIAMGLEASGKQFIWVVRKEKQQEGNEEWLLDGFEKRTEGKGLVIRGWAPQVLILEHGAIGGFVTHCGWNSILEGVCAGLPLVTWPVSGEQFYNEKYVTEILRIGVAVGAKKWARFVGDSVSREAVENAVNRIMDGEEAEEMRSRARALAKMAREAFEEGGSSSSDLNALIEELKLRRSA